MSNLEDVARQVRLADQEEKVAKQRRAHWRLKFFKAASETLAEESLAQEVVVITNCPHDLDAQIRAVKANPGWHVIGFETAGKDSWKILLEEDPQYKPFVFEGVERRVVTGSPMLDDDRLKVERPELYEAITFIPEPERQLKPLDELSSAQLAAIQEYIYYDTPSLQLRVKDG